ncbi:MAG: CRISPR-associated protein Cas5 [Clostridia bacterium]|nr:MAG: CRISPR-associated protein Cas5 [Clostridia bacterium]
MVGRKGVGAVHETQVLVFSLRGKLAHFRQPDTTVTQATYPFPPRPTLQGLLAAIMGIDYDSREWPRFLAGEHYLGLALLAPVRTVCMQMSLLGKGFVSGDTTGAFNRPTVMEMLVSPHYRVYYSGEAMKALEEKLAGHQSVFHTYLGSAFCLTFPEYDYSCTAKVIAPAEGEVVRLTSVVPREIVAKVEIEGGAAYAAARAMPYRHRGDRTFTGTATVFYETRGGPLPVTFRTGASLPYMLVKMPSGEVVCLW